MSDLTAITRKEKIISGEDLKPITREEMFLQKYRGSGGGGGASVQPDWNENNETAAGFVKNRTHYKYIGEVDLVPETSEIDFNNSGAAAIMKGGLGYTELTEGNTYNVYWNGAKYANLVAKSTTFNLGDVEGTILPAVGIGNLALFSSEALNTGESFSYVYLPSYPMVGISDIAGNDDNPVTFRLTENVEAYEPFDGRYLPKGLGYIIKEGAQTATNTLTWDGNTEGLENISVDATVGYFKVTDTAPSISDFVGSTLVASTPGGEMSFEITEDLILDGTAEGVPGFMVAVDDGLMAYVFTDNFSQDGFSATKGIYLLHATGEDGAVYVKSITALTDCFVVGEETEVKKIDNRLLDVEWLATKTVTETPIWDNVSLDLSGDFTDGATDILYSSDDKYFELVSGKKYNVTWNGKAYKNLEALELEGGAVVAIGDLSSAGGSGAGIPFAIAHQFGAALTLIRAVGIFEDVTVTVSIAEVDIVYNKLPEGYLPDSILGDTETETEIPEYDITAATMVAPNHSELTTIPIDASLVNISGTNHMFSIDAALRKGKTIKLTFSLGGTTYSAIVNDAVIMSAYVLFAVTINTTAADGVMSLVTVAFRLWAAESGFWVQAEKVPTASTITALEARIAALEGAAE